MAEALVILAVAGLIIQVLYLFRESEKGGVFKWELSEDMWNKTVDNPPERKVVLAAVDTHDCGWSIEVAWYEKDTEQWYVDDKPCHLFFSHWTEIPEELYISLENVSISLKNFEHHG